jgi:hypothetical protein
MANSPKSQNTFYNIFSSCKILPLKINFLEEGIFNVGTDHNPLDTIYGIIEV